MFVKTIYTRVSEDVNKKVKFSEKSLDEGFEHPAVFLVSSDAIFNKVDHTVLAELFCDRANFIQKSYD